MKSAWAVAWSFRCFKSSQSDFKSAAKVESHELKCFFDLFIFSTISSFETKWQPICGIPETLLTSTWPAIYSSCATLRVLPSLLSWSPLLTVNIEHISSLYYPRPLHKCLYWLVWVLIHFRWHLKKKTKFTPYGNLVISHTIKWIMMPSLWPVLIFSTLGKSLHFSWL